MYHIFIFVSSIFYGTSAKSLHARARKRNSKETPVQSFRRKFPKSVLPSGVRIDSGWNWTPSTSYSL